ncbi:p-loop containing nucleoside triphosphate hydrolase protein [Mycena venus]|uniref:p-loop containing nucleoside triphosphate hydrolase protein n=1 Tax=Mycena venus TaxID=2733690 RepID=A0A8H7CGF5_9AGAR|nr:p-loop containing nucleoside triphosphate hydrolase protein [Mycena venus]
MASPSSKFPSEEREEIEPGAEPVVLPPGSVLQVKRIDKTWLPDTREWQEVMEKYLDTIMWSIPILKMDPRVLLTFLPHLTEKISTLRSVSEGDASESSMEQHLTFLVDFLESEYSAILRKIRGLVDHGKITFDLLWAIFVPGDVLLTSCKTTEPRAFRQRGLLSFGRQYADLECEYVEAADNSETANSPCFGLAKKALSIHPFEGARNIADLEVYPIHYHPSQAVVEQKLVQRGEAWAKLHGIHHIQYDGIAWQGYEKVQVNGRVMIDRDTFRRMEPNYSLPAANLDLSGRRLKRPDLHGATYDADESLGHDLLLLTTPILYGFSLTEKRWLEFCIKDVAPIQWNGEVYAQLAVDSDRKDLLQALVESHGTTTSSFDDFVAGKGRGLVINLFAQGG